MVDPHVVTGLISKRAQIAGQIEHTQDKLCRWSYTSTMWTLPSILRRFPLLRAQRQNEED